jgi:hypothetical protein
MISPTNTNVYKTYSSFKASNYIFTICDTIGVKILYLISDKNVLYLSPLNIRKTRDIIRRSQQQDFDEVYITKNNRDLRKTFVIDKVLESIDIDAKTLKRFYKIKITFW